MNIQELNLTAERIDRAAEKMRKAADYLNRANAGLETRAGVNAAIEDIATGAAQGFTALAMLLRAGIADALNPPAPAPEPATAEASAELTTAPVIIREE